MSKGDEVILVGLSKAGMNGQVGILGDGPNANGRWPVQLVTNNGKSVAIKVENVQLNRLPTPEGVDCWICLGSDGVLLHGGCACRNTSGHGHVACVAEFAERHQKEAEERQEEEDDEEDITVDQLPESGWEVCPICKTHYNGPMLLGLARARWSKVEPLAENDFARMYAAEYLGVALMEQRTDSSGIEAVRVLRELVAVQRRDEVPGDVDCELETARFSALLAEALMSMCNYEEAAAIYQRTLKLYQREYEDGHCFTEGVMANLAVCVREISSPADSHSLVVEMWHTAKRVHGPEAATTLTAACAVATSFHDQDRFDEAIKLFKETNSIQQRVLGATHLQTMSSASDLAKSLQSLGNYGQAEPLLKQVLDVYRRERGREHRITLMAAGYYANVLQKMHRYREAMELRRDVSVALRRVYTGVFPEDSIEYRLAASAVMQCAIAWGEFDADAGQAAMAFIESADFSPSVLPT